MSDTHDQTSDISDIEEILEEARAQADQDSADIPDSDSSDDDSLLAKIQDLEIQLARSQADYQNLLRRMRTEQEELGDFTRAKIVKKILPVVDDFTRAIAHLPDDLSDNQWVQGILSLGKNLDRILSEADVVGFESIGSEVDPDKHDVISTGPGQQDIIIAEVEKGYMIGEKVLRHAKVVVGNGEDPGTGAQ